jgi:hypothetical protein
MIERLWWRQADRLGKDIGKLGEVKLQQVGEGLELVAEGRHLSLST